MDYYHPHGAKPVRLNSGILALGISNVHITKKDHGDVEKHFHKVTHLHLQDKGIDILDNLQAFTQLTVLYLYDNRIRVIENLGNCKHLEQLYLQRNWIQKISGLHECKKLRKLYLGFNEIKVLEGLECLPKLNELHIEHQRLPQGERLKMTPLTLDSLSRCLEILDISGNQLGTIEDFAGMLKLSTIISKENQIENLDKITLILTTIPELKVLDLQGNPITKLPKYKERVIGYGEKLAILDGKEVSRVSRQFMQRFCQAKSKRLQRIVNSMSANGMAGSSSLSTVSPDNSDTTSISGGPGRSKTVMSSFPEENRRSQTSTELEFIKQPPMFQHHPSKSEIPYPYSEISPGTSFSLLPPADSVPEFTLRPRSGMRNKNMIDRSDDSIRTIVPPKKTFPKSTLSKSIIDFKNLENPELYDSKRERKPSGMQIRKPQPMKDLPSRIFQKIADKFQQYGLPQDFEAQTQTEEIYSFPHYLSGPNQSYPSMVLPSKGKKKGAYNKSLSWTVMTPSSSGTINKKLQPQAQYEHGPWEGDHGRRRTEMNDFEKEIITTRSLQFKSPDLTESFYNLNLNEIASNESLVKPDIEPQSQGEKVSIKAEGSEENIESPTKPFESHVYQLPPWPHILRNVGSDQPKVTFIS